MPVSSAQVRLRASLFYLGSALFLGTGVVSIADQPLVPPRCANCTGPGVGCTFRGVPCTAGGAGAAPWPTCHQCVCTSSGGVPFCAR